MHNNGHITEATKGIMSLPNVAEPTKKAESFWGDDGFTFGDLVDAINPLQHIPIVSTIYRKITGDESSTGSNIAGGALFGGIIGLATTFIDSVIEGRTGKSIEGHTMALVSGKSSENLSNRQSLTTEQSFNSTSPQVTKSSGVDLIEISPSYESVYDRKYPTSSRIAFAIQTYRQNNDNLEWLKASHSPLNKDTIDILS